ncbi:MAG: 5-methyltetrahydropteroyltriglutamate--homocysteine S-methyltransferase [Pseudomonadota bacterium]|nr:5-methyltetrahydropteroyltriglutamate--homocysteine S-methyltransferase [Pseudomonadota bacterium]
MTLKNMRTDHVGSLLRPQSLIDAFVARGRNEIDDAALARVQDDAIRDIVAKQEATGLGVVSDGEFRRLNWQVSFSVVDGWDLWEGSWRLFLKRPGQDSAEEEKPGERGADAVEVFKVPATGKLQLRENFPLREYRFLKSVTNRTAKAMIMGPDRVAQMCDIAGSGPAYETTDAFLGDVAKIQNHMVGELVDSGCDYIQIDEPSYTGYVDMVTLDRITARGEDPMENLGRAVAASNAAIAGHEGKACFGVHICRGNRASMWHREGTYDGIAEYLFSNLRFDRLLLEYDTERAGGFEPLRFVPKGGPVVVLGLITTKSGEVERVDDLLARIEDAQRFVDIDQLAISPQCGFASGIGGNILGEDDQWRKLEVMQETARRIWS